MAVTSGDVVVRTSNSQSDQDNANSFVSHSDIEDIIEFRMDADVWNDATEDLQVRAMVSAYEDIRRLPWSNTPGLSQSRDYEFGSRFGVGGDNPPIEDSDFLRDVKKAQAAQTIWILAGTQVRDFSRDGVRMSKSLSGAEMEVTGYRGAVCAEAKELLAPYIENSIKMKRMSR